MLDGQKFGVLRFLLILSDLLHATVRQKKSFLPAACLHADRTFGGDRDHRDSGGDVVAGSLESEAEGLRDRLLEQYQATDTRLAAVSPGL